MSRASPSGPPRWSVLRDGALPGVLNMARDHALALSLAPGTALLRLYRWRAPTLSLGRNEPARDRFDRESLEGAGVEVVRRPTGGRAVLHHRELTYAVVLPLRTLGGVRESYRRVNQALRRGLASLGVRAEIAPERADGRVPGPDAGPCFDRPAPGEVMAAGRKLVGSAQARIGGSLLQHGSILVCDDQRLIEELGVGGSGGGAYEGGGGGAPSPATLEELLGGAPDWSSIEEAVMGGFREEMGGSWDGAPPRLNTDEELRLTTKYGSEEWTWRR